MTRFIETHLELPNPSPRWSLQRPPVAAKAATPGGRRMSFTPNARRGYVLIVVLFVLAIAGVATAAICRMSLEKAVQAGRAESDLRQRWAVATCRAVLLQHAEDLFSHSTRPEVRRQIVLNGQLIVLVFGDEQAKANVNLLYADGGLSSAEREVRTILGLSGESIPVELKPISNVGLSFGSPDAGEDDPRAFVSFGQIFPHQPPEGLLASRKWALVSRLTCWGDGSLNLRRATDESLRATLSRHMAAAEISKFIDARSKDPEAQIAELLDALELPANRREKVENILTEESTCHSLWIISDCGSRKRYDLSISERAVITNFSW